MTYTEKLKNSTKKITKKGDTMSKKENLIAIPVRISKEQRDWLINHPEINFSALVRRILDNYFIPYYEALEKSLEDKFKR